MGFDIGGWGKPRITPVTSSGPGETHSPAPANPVAPTQPQPVEDTFGTASGNASLDITGNSATASAEANVDLELRKGLNVHFGTSIEAKTNVESEDGFTTFTAEGTMSVSLGGEIDLGRVGFGADFTEGVHTEYQLRMSDADYQRMENGEIPTPDPFNPDTMPVGSSVVLNSENFTDTGFDASYQQLSLESDIHDESGVSVLVEKTGENTVRVTSGPTEAIENSWKLGLSLGPASVHLGNTTSLESATLRTAEFDLSTPEGEAAYNRYLTTGEVPSDNGPGVSDVASIFKVDFDSQSSVGGSLGPISGSFQLGSSNFDVYQTTYPDGSVDQITEAKQHAGTPVRVVQHFNPDGTEDFSRQELTMHFTGLDGSSEEQWAQTYGTDQHDYDGDMDIHMEFNAEDSMELSRRAQDYIAAQGEGYDPEFLTQDHQLIQALAEADNPTEVANALYGAYGGPAWMGNAFALIGTVGDEPMPGTITAQHR
ncbi:MAG: hypothetical protein M3Y59_15455 [Myxococcota bacterium]|nr:hypothetical protein [Myxococcota bacterium]